jgi:adenosylcobinamide-GDP ribazoletransferase
MRPAAGTHLRGLRLAAQFLTRLPVRRIEDYSPLELARSALWFPAVGLGLGVVTLLPAVIPGHQPLLTAALGVLAWTWMSGALHLDGLADLTDALAASHRDPDRFLAVLSDPHAGTFGVVSVVLVLLLKTAALASLARLPLLPVLSAPHGLIVDVVPPFAATLCAVALIPAWARLGPLLWRRWLRPLKPGQGERFAQHPLHGGWILSWVLALLAASALLAPVLCLAPLAIAGWGYWLKRRVGGMSGDCLGAGIEVCETVLIIALALASA